MQVADKKVKYVPEYLVQFDHLRKIALEYGLVLERKENFHDYYDRMMNDPNMYYKQQNYNSNLFASMVTRNMPDLPQESLDQ